MEDGQKIDINLESPLDTKSSDMLVSVQDTRFAHNRQKFQGHVLPTSLRYERNGWAAGWYVYDFKMGGGYIFSRNDTPVTNKVQWLAATRSKLNNTPTYVISFKTAAQGTFVDEEGNPLENNRANIMKDANAVATAVQFQAWYTLSPSINARECSEALIDFEPQPTLSLNYAVEGVDYKRKIKFNFDVCSSEDPDFECLTDSYGDADLSAEYIDRASDGTVSAILNNNAIKWVWDDTVYVPKDIIDADGFKFAKFVDVTNEVVTWKLGTELLQYDDAQNKFIYDEVYYEPEADLSIPFTIPLTYNVALHKYYSKLTNVTWAVQGTRILFNNESDSEPTNNYRLSTEDIAVHNISVHNGDLQTVGVDGPDIEVVSIAKFDLGSIDNVLPPLNYNATHFNSISVVSSSDEDVLVPVLNGTLRNFKLPGDDSTASRNVQMQLWFKFKHDTKVTASNVTAYPIRYPYANMDISEQLKEPIYADTATNDLEYSIDGKRYNSNNAEVINDFNNVVHSDTPAIFSRDICGRVARFTADVKGINGIEYAADSHLNMDILGVNTTLAFALSSSDQFDWQSESTGRQGQSYVMGDTPIKISYSYQETDYFIINSVDFTVKDFEGTRTLSLTPGTYQRKATEVLFDNTTTTTTVSIILAFLGLPTGAAAAGLGGKKGLQSYHNVVETTFKYKTHISGSYMTVTTGFNITQRLKINGKDYIIVSAGGQYILAEYNNDNVSMTADMTHYSDSISYMDGAVEISESRMYYKYTVSLTVEDCIVVPFSVIYALRALPEFDVTDLVALGNNNKMYTITELSDDDPGYISTHVVGMTQIVDLVTKAKTPVAASIPLPNTDFRNVTVCKFDIVNNEFSLYVAANISANATRWYYNVYYVYSGGQYWITNIPNAVFNLTGSMLANEIYVDLIDIDTGDTLLSHDTDYFTFESASLKVFLDRAYSCVGKLFFSNNISANLAERALLDPSIAEDLIDNVDTIHKESIVGNAFFPIVKSGASSIYRNDGTLAGYQGVAVFNINNISEFKNYKYHMVALSPLNRYILPPHIEEDTLYVFAGKAFTHHITIDSTVSLGSWSFLDDDSTNVQNIHITPKQITTLPNSIESANKYYTDKSMLSPAAITYYNNELHITYKPAPGNSITIAGSTYDLGASDMSIQQTASLTAVSLPAYDSDTKYTFALKSHDDVLNVKVTKDIINNIADVNKHHTAVTVSSVDFNEDVPDVTLNVTEYHEGKSPTQTTITYNANTIGEISDYSDENQLVIESSITGTAVITLPEMPDTGSFIYDIDGNSVSINANGNSFKYDFAKNLVNDMIINDKEVARAAIALLEASSDKQAYNTYHIKVDQSINTMIYFKHFGIYKITGLESGGYTPEVRQLTYNKNGTSGREWTINVANMAVVDGMSVLPVSGEFTFNFDDFDDKEQCTPKFLVYSATDVRNPDPQTQTKEFAKVMADNEYQLVKQHWDSTVATECFWWIDSTHTLKLTKDRFILEEKVLTDGYDDWMGDKWQTVYELNKTNYITSECDTFIVSSATGKNARGYLYILQPDTETSIKVTIYDPLNLTDGQMTKLREWVIEFKHVELSSTKKRVVLNEGNSIEPGHITVCTYSDIVSSSLLSDCKLSAVNINGTHWLGVQYDKNFNQWSFALGDRVDIIQGYGVIGINGYATGGMLPAKYFNGHGFSGEVLNISELEAEEGKTLKDLNGFNIFNERVVGDENQQWYIAEELSEVIMAVDLVKGNTIKLPLTNKYAQIYSSPSYAKYTVHALGIQIKQLMDMIIGGSDNPIWMEIIKYAMFPVVWYLSPYTNVINYLQQTLGQYAYVHYNSTSIGRQSSKLHDEVDTDNAGLSSNEADNHIDALITDDLSFDVQHIAQEQSFKDNSWDNILGIFASMVVSATDISMRDIAVNQLQNQTATSDIGKKFSQAFLQNIGSMSVTGFTMQSTKPMLKSEVTAVKTLDMFYSTSAQQNCYAGPGFVNMQFVAQCIAQSVTSVQLESQQTQIFLLLRQLTTWQGKVIIFLLDGLKDLMFKMSDVMGGGPSAGVVVGLGWIGALITAGVGYALVAAKALVKLGIEIVDDMLDSFFPGGIKTTVTAQLSRHNYDIEGKHAYGNKSESFMWPCADCKSKLYTDESVDAVLQEKPWPLEMPTATSGNMQTQVIYQDQPDCITITPDIMQRDEWNADVPYNIAMCKGKQVHKALPDSTAYVIGTESFMPVVPFKNENIGEGEPVFTPPPVQDYLIDKNWNIFVTAMAGDALWVSCKDTKLFDGNYSNIVVTDSFCGIAAPHVAVEVKRNICEEYLRPWAVSPDAIALNITGLNCAYEEVAYHAFDGYGYRITDWLGSSGMNKEHYTLQYCFQVNDRFKRSNKLPPNQFMGNFQAVPSMSLDIKDKVFNDIQVTTEEKGMRTGVAGENKDTQRYSLPIFTEQISSLPAIVRALSPYKLAVIDGITSLTTDVRISQSVYKIPDSVDFNINDKIYRMTNEYICSVDHQKGMEVVKYLVPALGLTYLGATPFMAYFYNQATRQYYIYQGGNTLQVMDMLERFRDIKSGTYDFINQEVVMPCLATMTRLDSKVKDDADETDNIVIPVFRHNKVGGELTPPIDTIFNTRSWYRTVSIPAGLVFQGPNRCIINRFIWSQYMLDDIKANKGKWQKVPREEYHPFRTYAEKYQDVLLRLDSKLKGWTHNPFLLVTSPLGVNEETDCKFEWEITFAWTTEMEQLYEHDEYVTVNVMAETMAPGGKVFSRPTHIFLHKELFTRTNNYGYYSFRYQSNNGAGNRERLHIWSDGYIAVSSLQLEYKVISSKRSEQLVTQEDIKGMKEM